jgi:predicted metalloendopeptidase
LLTHVQHKLKNQSKHLFDNVKKHVATLKNVTIEKIFLAADKTKKMTPSHPSDVP